MVHTHEYSSHETLEKRAWFIDSNASHHFTPYVNFLHAKQHYTRCNSVCVTNGKSLEILCIVYSCFIPKIYHHFYLLLSDILHDPCVTRNWLSISKFSKDNYMVF